MNEKAGQRSRPLPQLMPWSEQWWVNGRDGLLRIARCPDCREWVHPVQPVCPYCRNGRPAPEVASGRGLVAAVTVNHQAWSPQFPPPYVIVVVQLDESERLRVTTNIVGAGPEDVHIGQVVEVEWEQNDDVWVPVFRPTGEPDEPVAVDEPRRYAKPRQKITRKFEDDVLVSGIGLSEVGRRLMRDPVSLTVDACLAAVADAGLQIDDIDGLCTYPGAAPGGMSEGGVTPVVEALGLQPTWINGGGDTPGQIGSIIAGMLAVSAGLCRHVLCFRTVWEASNAVLRREGRISGPGGRVSGVMAEYRIPYGASSAANWIALAASQYFHRYGDAKEALGRIAVNARRNAGLNPLAVYRDPLTMQDYLDARVISTPFGLYDCDVPCDGAVAILLSSVDARDDLRHSVAVEAVGTRITERISWDQGTLTHLPQVWGPAEHVWTRTDLRPTDVDVAELYDGFSFNCLSWIEALGFCGIGEAADFIGDGRRIALDGELPLNTHGGQLSAGRTHGYGYVHEAVLQLRDEAGDRQVAGKPEVAMVSAGGGVPAGCFILRQP